jgi:ribosome-binding factor A
MPSPYRLPRVASRIKFLVSSIIQREIADPRVGLVTVLKVEPSLDLREAKVYISIFGPPGNRSRTQHALEDARGYIQKEVGKNLGTRNTPRLLFVLDESQDKVSRIEALVEQAKEEREVVMAKKPGKKDEKTQKSLGPKATRGGKPPKPEKGQDRHREDKAEGSKSAAKAEAEKPSKDGKVRRRMRSDDDDERKDFAGEEPGEEDEDKDFDEFEEEDEDDLDEEDEDEDEEEEEEADEDF